MSSAIRKAIGRVSNGNVHINAYIPKIWRACLFYKIVRVLIENVKNAIIVLLGLFAINAEARTVVTIDKDNKMGTCVMRAERGDSVTLLAIENLFAALNVEDTGKGMAKIKNYESPDGILNINCQIIPLVGFASCAVSVSESADSYISKKEELFHYLIEGEDSRETSDAFKKDSNGEFLFETPDGQAAFFTSPNKFMFKARVKSNRKNNRGNL